MLKRFGIALLFILLYVSPVKADSAAVGDISRQLICPCSCDIVLLNCDCETKVETTTLIEQQIEQGQSEEQIIQLYTTQYGENMLVNPPKQSSSVYLIGWVLSSIAIMGGGVAIYSVKKRKRSRARR